MQCLSRSFFFFNSCWIHSGLVPGLDILLGSIYEISRPGSTLSELQPLKAGVKRDNVPVANKTAALAYTLSR